MENAIKALEQEVSSLTSRLQQAEAALGKIDALEHTVNSGGGQQGGGREVVTRLESLESSVLAICQLQQDASGDPSAAKLPQMELRIAGIQQSVEMLSMNMQELANNLRQVAGQNNDIQRGLQGTIGYDIQNNFECEHCGSRSYVLGIVKCSSCGEEDWWGWWPPEDYEEEGGGDEWWGEEDEGWDE